MVGRAHVARGYREAGFGLILVMIMVAVMGTLLLGASQLWETAQRRERERELIWIGDAFREALNSYYAQPTRGSRFPMALEELLKDNRNPATVRHLRRLYADPIRGGTEWGLVKGPNQEIYGVYSLAEGTPLKTGQFDPVDKAFEGKARYRDWEFVFTPGAIQSIKR